MATVNVDLQSKPVVEVTKLYKLTLNQDEAQTIADILMGVGGSTTNSNRKHSDAVMSALQKAGVPGRGYRLTGSQMFKADSELSGNFTSNNLL
jgi:hypothetical protein